jgi:sRNA-binding protein
MNKKLTYSDYAAMSTEELRAMNQIIVGIIKDRQRDKIEDIKDQIRIGSKVKVNHGKTYNKVFTITEIRRKRATVRDNYGDSLNVPLSLVELYQEAK